MSQPGNTNARKGTRWRGAIDKALKQFNDDEVKAGHALDRIAWGLVRDAIHGDSAERRAARDEIGNRLDGKPVQAISGPEGEPITVIERTVVMPMSEARIIDAVAENRLEHAPEEVGKEGETR